MPATPDPIPLAELAKETANQNHSAAYAQDTARFVYGFCAFCDQAGVTHVPDERLADLAKAYLDVATISGSALPAFPRRLGRARA